MLRDSFNLAVQQTCSLVAMMFQKLSGRHPSRGRSPSSEPRHDPGGNRKRALSARVWAVLLILLTTLLTSLSTTIVNIKDRESLAPKFNWSASDAIPLSDAEQVTKVSLSNQGATATHLRLTIETTGEITGYYCKGLEPVSAEKEKNNTLVVHADRLVGGTSIEATVIVKTPEVMTVKKAVVICDQGSFMTTFSIALPSTTLMGVRIPFSVIIIVLVINIAILLALFHYFERKKKQLDRTNRNVY